MSKVFKNTNFTKRDYEIRPKTMKTADKYTITTIIFAAIAGAVLFIVAGWLVKIFTQWI